MVMQNNDDATPRSLDQLRDDHARNMRLVQTFLELIVDRRVDEALATLDGLTDELAVHILAEDDYWIPRFDRRFGKSRGFGADLLLAEHRLIETLLRDVAQVTRQLRQLPQPPRAEDVLFVVHVGFRLQGVLEHHHEREERIMIPALAEPPAATA